MQAPLTVGTIKTPITHLQVVGRELLVLPHRAGINDGKCDHPVSHIK
jgi:hypothetical protein